MSEHVQMLLCRYSLGDNFHVTQGSITLRNVNPNNNNNVKFPIIVGKFVAMYH